MTLNRGFPQRTVPLILASAALLAGLLLLTSCWNGEPPLNQRSRSDLNNLKNALKMYFSDWRAYPPDGNPSLVRHLQMTPKFTSSGCYMSFRASGLLVVDGAKQFVDPFGHPYHYRVRTDEQGRSTPDSFGNTVYLWSDGADGVDEAGAVLEGCERAANDEDLLRQRPGDDVVSWY